MRNPDRIDAREGFGVVLVLGVLFLVGSMGLALGTVLEGGLRGSSREVERSAAFYLAEGIVERMVAERLAGDPDWSDVPADTLYNGVPLDRGTCTLVASNPSADQVDVLAQSHFRDTFATVQLRVHRVAGNPKWERLAAPFTTIREE